MQTCTLRIINFLIYDCIIILNIFQCIITYAALYMYDQCIVGFMMIEDIGLELDAEMIQLLFFHFNLAGS